MNNKLEPVRCGCGGEAEVFHVAPEGYAGSYCVRCVKCLTQSPFFTGNKEKAIETWNRAMGIAEKSSTVERTAKVENIEDPAGMGAYGDCSECGAEVNEQYAYCPNCGAKLDWSK